MAPHGEFSELAKIFRSNGDKLLDASCKLALSATLIQELNHSLLCFCKQKEGDWSFQSAPNYEDDNKGVCDLQLLYDFIQKVVALKILPGPNASANISIVDLQLFRSLRLLEVNRFSLNLIKGLKYLRSHLEYLICIRSFSNLCDLLEHCGADKCQGYVWMQLKKAVFSYNNLSTLDASLEFIPKLEILDLSHNNLTDANMVNCLPRLENLNLGYNRLQSVPRFTGSLCNNLQSLCLNSNFIEDIKDLSTLINLKELDLSKNSLLDHCVLVSISCLSNLEWLNLLGNPLSYHPCHRTLTIRYLHPQIRSNFILDYVKVNKIEMRVMTSPNFVEASISRSASFNSQITDTTVINKNSYFDGTFDDVFINSEEAINTPTSLSTKSNLSSDKLFNEVNSNNYSTNDDCREVVQFNPSSGSLFNNSWRALTDTLDVTINDTPQLNDITNLNNNIEEKAGVMKFCNIVKENIVDAAENCLGNSEDIFTASRRCNIVGVQQEMKNDNINVVLEETNMFNDENIHMQDSGFFAATRPISPSQSSIGSASSLVSNKNSEVSTLYESDIEVLTNPSQSSIEVLDNCDHDSVNIRFSPS